MEPLDMSQLTFRYSGLTAMTFLIYDPPGLVVFRRCEAFVKSFDIAEGRLDQHFAIDIGVTPKIFTVESSTGNVCEWRDRCRAGGVGTCAKAGFKMKTIAKTVRQKFKRIFIDWGAK